MSSLVSHSALSFADVLSSSSVLYAVLAAVLVVALQPVLSLSSPLLSRHPRLHLTRRLQHVVSNLLLAWLCTSSSLFTRSAVLLVLSAVVVLLLCLHLLRRSHPSVNSAFVRACGSLLRPHELHGLPSGYYSVLSVLLCVALQSAAPSVVSMAAVRLSLLYEAVGDPMAGVVGTVMAADGGAGNKKTALGKTAAGSVGMWLTCTAVTVVYLVAQQHPLHVAWLAVAPALGAAVERYTGRGSGWLGVDDNLTVPTVTCLLLSLLQAAHMLPTL